MAKPEQSMFTPEQESTFLEMWVGGAKTADIEQAFGMRLKSIHARTRHLDLPPRGQVMRALPSDPYVGDIIRLHESGLTPCLIGKKLNIGHTAVGNVLARHGIEPVKGALGPKPKDEQRVPMGEFERARVDEQEVEAGCIACDWKATGTFAETRLAFRLHDCQGHAAVAA